MGPKPVKNDLSKVAPDPWGGSTDLSRPFLARFDLFYGYTAYQIPETGHRYTGQKATGGGGGGSDKGTGVRLGYGARPWTRLGARGHPRETRTKANVSHMDHNGHT